MGMIWNSPATNEMVAVLNREFGPGFIRKWRKIKSKFKPVALGGDPLDKIADDMDLYPDGGAAGSGGTNWQAWLQYLTTTPANGVGEQIKSYIYAGLDPNQFKEIVFVVVPQKDGAYVTASATSVAAGNNYVQVITINTPTFNAVYNFAKTKIGRRTLERLRRQARKR